jgi:hypothetical protein
MALPARAVETTSNFQEPLDLVLAPSDVLLQVPFNLTWIKTCTLAFAGLRIPFNVTFGSPMDGVFVMLKVNEEAAVALCIPMQIKDSDTKKVMSFFTR